QGGGAQSGRNRGRGEDSVTSNPSPTSDQPNLPLGGGSTGGPDPWGMKRIENLITSLVGIVAARVVVTPLGEVSEIHVTTRGSQQPKQTVRNIEWARMPPR